jgi:Txe/YoeB family toxin of Txe-Axe toxin-antitoxin module
VSFHGRKISIGFADCDVEKAFEELKKGKFEDRRLLGWLEAAIKELRRDPLCGVRIPSKLWPAIYIKKYGIDNLRKYDLPDGWRLLYTIHGNEVEIISILIEWLDHKNYEKRFGYKTR